MNPLKIGIEIKRIRDSKGKEILKAAVPMGIVFEKEFDASFVETETEKFEQRYTSLVEKLKFLLQRIKDKSIRNRVLIYWEFGHLIDRFIDANNDGIFMLGTMVKHLTRDTGASDKLITRTRRFYRMYPSKDRIDPNRSFDSYVATFEGGYISKHKKSERDITIRKS